MIAAVRGIAVRPKAKIYLVVTGEASSSDFAP
jgi:hypothetical protein